MNNIKNSKALDLDAVRQSHNKVTIGFKCNPHIKLDLAEQANKLGLTLSEYVENIIANSGKEQCNCNAEKNELLRQINDLQEKIEFYENAFLKELFGKYENKKVQFINAEGNEVNLKIVGIRDVFTVIINSFKIKNND
jgi:hypothetical protein